VRFRGIVWIATTYFVRLAMARWAIIGAGGALAFLFIFSKFANDDKNYY